MGIPVITGPDIGDIDNYILKNDNIGYVIKDFNNKETDKRNIDEINFYGDRILNSTINEIFQLSK